MTTTTPQAPPQARPRALSRRALWLLLVAAMPLWMSLGSCDYVQRFFLIIRENRNPCVGVISFAFELEALEAGQEAIVSQQDAKDAIDTALFWNISTGQCQRLDAGIALKEIPYGGERKLTIKGLDSSGRLVSLGTSPPFLLEASGDAVVDQVNMDLVRGCRAFNANGDCTSPEQIGYGTLIIRFPIGALPAQTNTILFQLEPDPKQTPANFEVRVQVGSTLPGFLILANVPAASGRKYTIEAYTGAQKVATLAGTYSIAQNPQPTTGTARVEPQPKP